MERSADVVIGATFDDSFDTVIGQTRKRVTGLGNDLDGAVGGKRSSKLDNAKRRIDQSREATRRARGELRGGIVDGVALGAALLALTQPAIQFESAMADVAKVMDLKQGTEQYDAIAEGITRLSEEIPLSAEGLASIVESAGQMGLAGQEALDFAEDAAKMGIAFDLTAEQAGTAMKGMRASLQLGQEEVLDLANTLNFVSNQAGVTGGELANFMTTGGVRFAKAAGVGQEELVALGATLGEMNIASGEAGTAIRNFFQTLTKGEQLEDRKADILTSIGLDPAQIAAQISEGGPAARDAIDEVLTTLEGVADEKRAGVLSKVFGSFGVSTVTALIESRDRLEEIRELADADAGTSMLDEFETRANTTEFALEGLMSTITNLSIAIGSTLLPIIRDMVDTLKPVVIGVTELAQEYPKVTKVVFGAAAAFAALKIGALASGFAFSFVKEGALVATKGMITAYQTATGQNWAAIATKIKPVGGAVRGIGAAFRAVNIAMLANPIGLTVAAVGLAITGVALTIRKYWEPLSAWFTGVWDGISNAFSDAKDTITKGLGPITTALEPLQPVFEGIGTAVGAVVGWFKDLLEPVKTTDEEFGKIHQNGMAIGDVIGTVLVGAIDTLLAPLRLAVWAFTNLSEAAANIWDWFTALPDKISEFGNMVSDVFSKEGFIAAGKAAVSGIWEGMRSMWGDLMRWFSGRINALLDVLPDWVADAMGIERQDRVLSDNEIAQKVDEQLDGFGKGSFSLIAGLKGGATDEEIAAERARVRAELEAKNDAVRAAREAQIQDAVDDTVRETRENTADAITQTRPQASAAPKPETFKSSPVPTENDPVPVSVAKDATSASSGGSTGSKGAVAETYRAGAELIKGAMAQAVELESARAAALAAERPRSITSNVEAPITVNNYGPADKGGQAVREGVAQGASDALAAERDQYAD